MADIELVIKIPEEVKNRLCFGITYPKDIQVICEALNDGTPLPKGHKRLIEDNFEVGPVFDKEGFRIGYKYITQEDLGNAETIIPADDESGK